MPPGLAAIESNRWSEGADKLRGAATVSEEIVAIASATEAGAAVGSTTCCSKLDIKTSQSSMQPLK